VKILLTGATSFTGFHFARALAAAGHHVVAPVRGRLTEYPAGPRAERAKRLPEVAEVVEGVAFGSDGFLDLVRVGGYGALCHHAAKVGDYRAADYDILGSVSANTHRLPEVLAALDPEAAVVATGSVFEADEGAGNAPLVAFSPYGLSKGLSWQILRHWCLAGERPFGKFTIPNPFGPFEEPRFGAYLMKTWKAGAAAEVRTPAYVRDNIHVDLLALGYAGFVADVAGGMRDARLNPSGYVETQGAFTLRFAEEMRRRSGLACEVSFAEQVEFSEPAVRINTDRVRPRDWSEAAAWDGVAEYYQVAG
jgi:nucleoside-diphosphate-sugar epimerase